jgi:N-acetylglucosamine-6-phosphate deacetylase
VAFTVFVKKVFTGSGVLNDQLITCDKGKIISVENNTGENASHKCECISAGFMDIHINGGAQYYFSESPNTRSLKDIEDSCLEEGTLYTLPTLITSPTENIFKGIEAVREYKNKYPDTGIIGLHLEGPFLHPAKRGAHMEKFLQKPTDELLKRIISEGEGIVKMMTIAPELFNDEQLEMLIASGITISAGHSNATYEQAQYAFEKGITLVTHLFNAMSAFTHRAPGLIGAAFDNENVYTPVILDGDHSHFASASIAYKVKKDKFFIISDALFVGGKVTEFKWGEYDAKLIDGKYINSEGNLTGAVISMGDAVRNAVNKLNIPLDEAIQMATLRPAVAIGISGNYGKIAPGYPARFTVFDERLQQFSSLT